MKEEYKPLIYGYLLELILIVAIVLDLLNGYNPLFY